MERNEGGREVLARGGVMLFTGDTVVRAVETMQRHRLQRLPVVDEERGELLGEVQSGELHEAWTRAPLASMWELLAAKEVLRRMRGIPPGEGTGLLAWLLDGAFSAVRGFPQ